MSLFPRNEKNEVMFCIICFILFPRIAKYRTTPSIRTSANNYRVFLAGFYIINAFYFHEMERSVNDLSCIPIVKTIKEGN